MRKGKTYKFKKTTVGDIPENWGVVKVSDISSKVAIGPFGSSIKVETFVSEGVPVISGQHLRGTRLEDGDYNFIKQEHAEKLRNAIVYRGDVIFTHAGNIGQVAYIPNTSKYSSYIISQRQFYLRCDPNKILPEFITFFFKTPIGQHALLSNRSQTGVPSIAQPVNHLKSIEIPLPPLDEQTRIVEIISSFEDKIELDRNININLENIAQLIFRNWFLEDKKNKLILKGMGKLSDICEFNPRHLLPKGSICKYVEMKNLSEKLLNINNFIENKFTGGSKFINGDTLLARITPCLENGKTGLVDFLENGEVGCGSTEFIIMHPKQEQYTEYLYILARSKSFREYAIQSMSGTSGRQRVQVDSLTRYEVPIPSGEILQKFHNITSAIFGQIKFNNSELKSLERTKGFILSRLFTGRIRV